MLCLFEDRFAANFFPLSLTRHVSDLLAGTATLGDGVRRVTEHQTTLLHGRAYIREYYAGLGIDTTQPEDTTLFVNARFPITRRQFTDFPDTPEWVLRCDEDVVAALLDSSSIERLAWEDDTLDFAVLHDIPIHQTTAQSYSYLWDMIADNAASIERDFGDWYAPVVGGTIMNGVHSIEPHRITIGEGSVIKPGVVLDATHGPIIIGSNVVVMPNAVIEGPCYIGDNCVIKAGAKIYEGTSIGPWCKVGGEMENSIIIGYSNKQHDGFLGHSYLGRWVNLGADTNTSDLKNNYGNITITLNGNKIETGTMFLGSLIGDHSKTGINTMLNTGTVIGVSSNIFGGGFPPKAIPSFAWGGSDGLTTFDLDKAIALAKTVMARRNVEFTMADDQLFRTLVE